MSHAADQDNVEKIKNEVSQAMAVYHQSLGKCPPEKSVRLENVLLEKNRSTERLCAVGLELPARVTPGRGSITPPAW